MWRCGALLEEVEVMGSGQVGWLIAKSSKWILCRTSLEVCTPNRFIALRQALMRQKQFQPQPGNDIGVQS